ncbi:MAG: serine/threonine protein kinase [Bryobacterales bacterium]|nr:serine/threonine protein kinase [Bryobacterales bacterium]
MSPERFQQVRNVFEAALEQEPSVREQFVAQAAASDEDLLVEVRRMLQAHRQKVTYLDGALTAPSELRTDPLRLEGRRLGNFDILREIGRGGMGTVFLARRADGLFLQHVAIKVLSPEAGSEETLRRFQQERSILASLDHPNIARLYDGGTTEEGWPYFVMEFVEGLPIDKYCEEQKLNTSARLRLFQTVCAAAHYAHRHGVVHRDLKPGNILVTRDGEVKLLDFGIAKLLQAPEGARTVLATQTGMLMMTPEYAGPEQLLGQETAPATDVYSLGVILYELLTGRRPYALKSRMLHEIIRVVCEQPVKRASTAATGTHTVARHDGTTQILQPAALSATREGTPIDLQRRLSGDIDTILEKTLSKEPADRYPSADHLRADIERHLNGQPILAARQGPLKRVSDFLGKNKAALVLGLSAAGALATGAIQIEFTAALYVGAACLILGLWYAATDRRAGTWIHRHVYGGDVLFVLVCLALLGLALYVADFYLPSRNRYGDGWAWVIGFWALLVYFSGLAISWIMRQRWAGRLLLRTRWGKPGYFGLILLLYYNIKFFVRLDSERSVTSLLPMVLFFIVGAVYSKLVAWFEIRDRGVLHQGVHFSWLEMQSHGWENEKKEPVTLAPELDGEKLYLCLQVRRRLPVFSPRIRVAIPAGDRERVDSFFRQHLAVWPDSSSVQATK